MRVNLSCWALHLLQPVLEKYSGRTMIDSFHFCSNTEDFLQNHEAAGTFMKLTYNLTVSMLKGFQLALLHD